MRNRIIILVVLVFFTVLGITTLSLHDNKKQPQGTTAKQIPTSTPSAKSINPKGIIGTAPDAEMLQKIIINQISDPSLQSSGFVLNSTDQVAPGWFVVRITPTGTDSQVMLLRQNSDGTFTVVAKPDSQIPLSLLQQYSVPQTVINQLPVDGSD